MNWWTVASSVSTLIMALATFCMAHRTSQSAKATEKLAESSEKTLTMETKRDMFLRRPYVIMQFDENNPVETSITNLLLRAVSISNLSSSPALEVCLNFYSHNINEDDLDTNQNSGAWVLKTNRLISEGISAKEKKPLEAIELLQAEIQSIRGLITHNFQQIILPPVPSDNGGPASWSKWNLIVTYKGVDGVSYFTVYKYKTFVQEENNPKSAPGRFVFLGCYSGNYDSDVCLGHEFMANHGWPDEKSAPDWTAIVELMRQQQNIVATGNF